jgi:hypothetical protein
MHAMMTAADYLYANTTVKYKCFGQLLSFIFGKVNNITAVTCTKQQCSDTCFKHLTFILMLIYICFYSSDLILS